MKRRSSGKEQPASARLFWLVFKRGEDVVLIIQPATTMEYAQLRASIALNDGKYQEGYELDEKMVKKVPKKMIGAPLTQKQANALLKKLR